MFLIRDPLTWTAQMHACVPIIDTYVLYIFSMMVTRLLPMYLILWSQGFFCLSSYQTEKPYLVYLVTQLYHQYIYKLVKDFLVFDKSKSSENTSPVTFLLLNKWVRTLSKEIYRANNANSYAELCITKLWRCKFLFVHTSTCISSELLFLSFSLDLTGGKIKAFTV